MATYFVASGGSNTAPYDTWAKAATSIATALAAATSNGDFVVIQYDAVPSGDKELAADTTYTFAANIFFVSATNNSGSSWTATEMGTGNWIGNSTTNRGVILAGSDRQCWLYGLTIRTAGSTDDNITVGSGNGQTLLMHNCYLWSGNTSSSSTINLGNINGAYVRLTNCTLRFGNVNQNIFTNGRFDMIGGSVSSAGSAPTRLVDAGYGVSSTLTFSGVDLSHVTGTLVDNLTGATDIIFERCKLGSGVVVLASQTSNPTLASAAVFVRDCSSGDTHGLFGFYNALGSVVSDTGIYFTAGNSAQSWKIVTTANASRMAPFKTPTITWIAPGLSSITPRFEILRDGSSTAFTDNEVWAEFLIKSNSGSTLAAVYTDGIAIGATPSNQAAGAGLGSWTGESGTAWSGKIDSGSAVTPAELGDLTGSIFVGLASTTLYINPEVEV